jgi:hypothetical protein
LWVGFMLFCVFLGGGGGGGWERAKSGRFGYIVPWCEIFYATDFYQPKQLPVVHTALVNLLTVLTINIHIYINKQQRSVLIL